MLVACCKLHRKKKRMQGAMFLFGDLRFDSVQRGSVSIPFSVGRFDSVPMFRKSNRVEFSKSNENQNNTNQSINNHSNEGLPSK